jgi:uncharacterized protein (TIGR02246 family)
VPEPAEAVTAATALYRRLIDGWNTHDADAMGAALLGDSLVIGFDGSQMLGREQAVTELSVIFADHEVARYITKIRSVTPLGADAAVLHAVAGMVPPGSSAIKPEQNSIQTVVAHGLVATGQSPCSRPPPHSSTGGPSSARPSPQSSTKSCSLGRRQPDRVANRF